MKTIEELYPHSISIKKTNNQIDYNRVLVSWLYDNIGQGLSYHSPDDYEIYLEENTTKRVKWIVYKNRVYFKDKEDATYAKLVWG